MQTATAMWWLHLLRQHRARTVSQMTYAKGRYSHVCTAPLTSWTSTACHITAKVYACNLESARTCQTHQNTYIKDISSDNEGVPETLW